MIIERLWPDNRLRNYHYLVACSVTGEAIAIDPLDAALVYKAAQARGWQITTILNTHHHHDHIDGNEPLRALTGATVLAHAGATSQIPGVDRGLSSGDIVSIGHTVNLRCLDTPGHTMSHICLFADGNEPALFSGDTLFNAGAGNCHNGGSPDRLYETFAQQLERLPAQTRVFAGHDYLLNNLGFTLDREPSNADAAQARDQHATTAALEMPVMTLADERRVNSFFRLRSPEIISRLREKFPELAAEPSARDVFLRLRQLRNHW